MSVSVGVTDDGVITFKDENGNLILVGPVERPFVNAGETFDNVDRMLGAIAGRILTGGHSSTFKYGSGTLRTRDAGTEDDGRPESLHREH